MIHYVSADDLAARYNVNRSTIWRWAQRGIIPQPTRISEQCTRWNLAEVEQRDAERSDTDFSREVA